MKAVLVGRGEVRIALRNGARYCRLELEDRSGRKPRTIYIALVFSAPWASNMLREIGADPEKLYGVEITEETIKAVLDPCIGNEVSIYMDGHMEQPPLDKHAAAPIKRVPIWRIG